LDSVRAIFLPFEFCKQIILEFWFSLVWEAAPINNEFEPMHLRAEYASCVMYFVSVYLNLVFGNSPEWAAAGFLDSELS
jgi:hypothetical protein